MPRSRARLIVVSILSTLALPALASDGVREINQACAVQTGCFSGDAASFPITITTPGSYALTSNLVVPDENTTGIAVNASSVTIDLNGFEIVRSGCEAATSSCTPASGGGSGIAVDSSLQAGVVVHDGSVLGMGSHGVFLGYQAQVKNVQVRWNRLSGIRAGTGAILEGNVAVENGSFGIDAGFASILSGNVVGDNGGIGIVASDGATLSGNSAISNAQHGIVVGSASLVSSNTANGNGGEGISADVGSILSGNTAQSNALRGLRLLSHSTYRQNTVTSNAAGTVLGGVNRGDNYCAGPGVVSAFCP